MRKKCLAAMTLAALALPASAIAKPPTRAHLAQYDRAYRLVAREFGKRAPGCKLGRTCHRRVTDQIVLDSFGVLERMLAPAPAPATPAVVAPRVAPTYTSTQVTSYPSAQISAPTSTSGSSGSLPYCTWGPESGGNWNAVNPSSGAYGRYQIMPGTAAAYGCNLGSHDGQTACAEKIMAGQGRRAWVNC